jgi:acetyl-CoA decarbonylase/synthase complex subunit gamma
VGGWKARWGIGRLSYLVPPGLYAIGSPDSDSPVLVTANYRMSYDCVRQSLAGRSVWLLVLETYGINVWCAAGKGTFGTGELVRRIKMSGLAEIVGHRELILPLLGAAGVKALEVQKRSGFSVRFATIRAADLPAYLDGGFFATAEMRELTFTLHERLVLVPIELVSALKSGWPFIVLITLCAAIASAGQQINAILTTLAICLSTIIAGAVAAPLLLPWLPGRSFALKGALTGLAAAALIINFSGLNTPMAVAAILPPVTAISSFLMLNFTGSTPFTCRTGVKKEMRVALPLHGIAMVCGMVAAVVWRFR